MDSSSSRILTTSSMSNTSSRAIIIPAVKHPVNPLRIGDAALQRLRIITTTPPVKSSTEPAIFIMNNNYIKSETPRTITINRLVLPGNPNIINGQNTINLSTLVNSLTLLQSTPNSISKLLQTPMISSTNAAQPSHNSKFLNSYFSS
jgi:hypothetical protein